jgi:hypothetical protein
VGQAGLEWTALIQLRDLLAPTVVMGEMSMTEREAPEARIAKDPRSPHFVFFDHVIYSHEEPSFSVVQSDFFESHTSDDLPLLIHGKSPHPRLRVIKNIYNLTPVFVHMPALVVNAPVRDILAACCTVEFAEVIIERAFWFPYGPGDHAYEQAGIDLQGRSEDVMARFAEAFPHPAPAERFYRVIVHGTERIRSRYIDVYPLRVAWDSPAEGSVGSRELGVSREMIEEHGLVFGGGYLCRPDVFDMLNPYLHRPYFWSQRYLY